jgi:uncharacterized protein YbcV (DUF1398 family)
MNRRYRVDAVRILDAARASLSGAKPFAQIVGDLLAQGVEYYQVDYAARSFRFHGVGGAMVQVPLDIEGLPAIAERFDAAALQAAIADSQANRQTFRAFCERAMRAGVQGYFAFLRGQRVTYLGRLGDQHTEWFPGARPAGYRAADSADRAA